MIFQLAPAIDFFALATAIGIWRAEPLAATVAFALMNVGLRAIIVNTLCYFYRLPFEIGLGLLIVTPKVTFNPLNYEVTK